MKSNYKTRILTTVLLFAAIIVLLLCGCGKDSEETPSPAPEATASPVVSPELTPEASQEPSPEPTVELVPQPEPEPEPEAEIKNPNPLTGLPMKSDKYLNNRPYAVMINNLKAALPQHGIRNADIIYEVLAEGGITRMVAVFQNPYYAGDIGSIRSTRSYYLDIAEGHDAIHVHAGGSPQAYDLISARSMDNIDGISAGCFWRDQDRINTKGYEHSMFTSGKKLVEYVYDHDYRTKLREDFSQSLTFADDGTPENGVAAEVVTVEFSTYKTGVFTYQPGYGVYTAEQYGEAYIDGESDKQVYATNVLVLFANQYGIPGDPEGRQEVELVGSGNGIFACGGKSIYIKWSKESYDSPFVYTHLDGSPLEFGRGKSYINIVPIGSHVSSEALKAE
ncbi:MAG: DUF3048 domain-containing protein [Ruminococcaceae bacterium]|nr:DUF3048 domain-containing protein [Oscillospiraceae bacterium]